LLSKLGSGLSLFALLLEVVSSPDATRADKVLTMCSLFLQLPMLLRDPVVMSGFLLASIATSKCLQLAMTVPGPLGGKASRIFSSETFFREAGE
jgi:hypothetical protein